MEKQDKSEYLVAIVKWEETLDRKVVGLGLVPLGSMRLGRGLCSGFLRSWGFCNSGWVSQKRGDCCNSINWNVKSDGQGGDIEITLEFRS